MSNVKRIYVEKKKPYDIRAKELKGEIQSYLGMNTIENVRVFIRYDIENIKEETYQKALSIVFSEPPVDILYKDRLPEDAGNVIFSVEYLPGQFDQRADSAEQCVQLLDETEEPTIRSATTYALTGNVSKEELIL